MSATRCLAGPHHDEHLRFHCAEAITSANRRIYEALVGSLSDAHRCRLDALLERPDNGAITRLAWLRQSPTRPNSRYMLEHIERLKAWQELDLRIGDNYVTLRRYAPELLSVLKLRAAPAATNLLDAIEVLRVMNTDNARKMPANAPTDFIKPRWQKLVMTNNGLDRRHYELCALSEWKNALRSGDIWVQGSRQFKDFDEYLVPSEKFTRLKQDKALPLVVATDCDQYLHNRLTLLETELDKVNGMALSTIGCVPVGIHKSGQIMSISASTR